MSKEDSSTKSKLKGQDNYLEWSKRFEHMAVIKKWGSFKDSLFIVTQDNDKADEALEC